MVLSSILSRVPIGITVVGLETNASACPYWAHYNHDTKRCECGSDIFSIVNCKSAKGPITEMNVSVIYGYCITLDSREDKAVVGACPYHHQHCTPECHYHLINSNLTAEFCGRIKRAGQLCGQCMEGYSPPVYAFYSNCVKCSPGTNNWPKYLAISLLPVFPFLVAIAVFRFNALSPKVTGYILTCQILTSPILIRSLVHSRKREIDGKVQLTLYFMSLSGIWNLEAFNLIYSPFCIHSKATTLQVLSLDYLSALSPLIIILFTYTLVRLHYNNCRLVVWLWRPFISCFVRCRRHWDMQNALVDAFATFLLLSFVKISNVSLNLLTPTILWNSRREVEGIALYYEGSLTFFGKTHLPYAILAITVLSVFIILPILLLCLYPCPCFQRALNRFHCNSAVLHFFMNSFQGCFKNGTTGTKDCRWFSAVYLLLRLALHIGFIVCNNFFSTFVLTVVLLGMIVLLAIVQPYKEKRYTKVDIIFITILCLALNSAWELHGKSAHSLSSYVDEMYLLLAPVVILYPLWLLISYVLQISRSLRKRCLKQLKLPLSEHFNRNNAILSEVSPLI